MDANNAGALLNSTQQLRVHWSSNIITIMGFSILINVAIWSYFLGKYVDKLVLEGESYVPYIVAASALSAVILGLWRLYAHHIDNSIANLYPDLLWAENELGITSGYGTQRYLSRAVPITSSIFTDDQLAIDKKIEAISILVSSNHMGRRGHYAIDLVSFILTLGMLTVNIFWANQIQQQWLAIAFPTLTVTGLLLVVFSLCCFHKNPSQELIDSIKSQLIEKN